MCLGISKEFSIETDSDLEDATAKSVFHGTTVPLTLLRGTVDDRIRLYTGCIDDVFRFLGSEDFAFIANLFGVATSLGDDSLGLLTRAGADRVCLGDRPLHLGSSSMLGVDVAEVGTE